MGIPLKVLIVEDSEDDAILLLNLLKRDGYEVTHERVETEDTMRSALLEKSWDIILCDYRMPQFDGMRALKLVSDMGIDIPFIIVSGVIGEDIAVECMKAGAHGYIMKDKTQRFVPTVEREIREAAVRRERRGTERELNNLAMVIKHSSELIYLAAQDGALVFMNEAGRDKVGISLDEISQYRIFDILSPDYRESAKRVILPELMRSGSWRGDLQYRNIKTDAVIDVYASFFTIKDTFTGTFLYIASVSTDISERKKTEKKIMHLASFPQFSPILILEIERGGAITYVNPAMQRALAEMGETDATLFVPQDIHAIVREGRISEEKEITREVVLHGRIYTEKFCFLPTFNVIRVYAYDITTGKRAEEDLKRSELYYRLIFENSGEAIFLTAPDGRIFSANPEACRMVGRNEAEICSIGRYGVIDAADPRLPSAIEERERTGRFKGELTGLRAEGQKFPCELSSVIFRDQDGQLRTSMVIHDLTERKLLEESLRQSEQNIILITDNVPALVSYLDSDGYYRFANKCYEEWFGVPVSEIIGKHYSEILGRDVYEKINTYIQAALSGKQVFFEEYLPYVHGGSRWVFIQYVPDPGGDGEIKGLFALVTDITKRKMAEEQLSRSMKQFENMVKNVPGIIYKFAVHPDGSMTFPYISDNARMIGLEPDEVMKDAQKLIDTISSDDLPGLMETIHESAQSLNTWQWEGRFIVSGKERWYRGISQPTRFVDGTIEWDGLIMDVMEQKEAMEKLRELQRFSTSTIDALVEHVAVLDEEGTIIAVNRSWRDFAENNPPVTQNVCEGANYLLVCDNAKGEDAEQARAFSKGIKAVIKGEEETSALDYPCHSPDKKRWFMGRVTRFSGPGPIRVVVAHEDITERKLAEEALQKSEEQYRNIFNDAIIGIYQTTPEGRFLNANPALARMYGYDTSEELINSITDLATQSYLHHEERETFKGILLQKGAIEKFETQLRRKNGESIWVSINAHTVKDKQGNIVCFDGTIENITERKRAEEAIRLSEERFKNLYQESPNPAFIWQKKGEEFILVDFNRAMTLVTKGKVGNYLGTSAAVLYRDRPDIINNMELCYREQSIVRQEIISRNFAPGRLFSVYYGFIPPDSIIAHAEDITERKLAEEALRESEERYKTITEKTIAGIYLIQDGLYRYVNPTFCNIHGYTKDELVDKLSPLDLVVGKEKEFLNDKIRQRLSGEKESERFSIRIRRKDGEIRFLEVFSSYALYAGKPAVLGTCIDVTEAREATEKIKRSQKELRSLTAYLQNIREEERIRIAREIHDELGQSLTGIKIDISWLKKKLSNIVEPKDPIQAKIDSLLVLTESTIVATRELSLSLRPGILDDLGLEAAIKWQLKRFQEKKGIVCMFQSDVAEIAIPTDYSTVLFRISQECLTNISRHANATNVKITLTGEGKNLILEIEDNGKGITKEQIENPLSLGLLGMRERIMGLKGRFSISGEPGKETKVRVELPVEAEGEKVESEK